MDSRQVLWPAYNAAVCGGLLLMLAGMAFPRYFKRRKWWLKAHRYAELAATTLGLAGAGLALLAAGLMPGRMRLLHGGTAVAGAGLSLFNAVYGSQMVYRRNKRRPFRAVHRRLGRLSVLLMAAMLGLGLAQLGLP